MSVVTCLGTSSAPVLLRIYERRTNPKVKKIAEDFLMNINSESLIQIAMMCDAAQEELDLLLVQVIATPYLWLPMVFAHRWFYSKPWTIALSRIRLCDKNTIDVAQLRLALDDFMKKVSALFLQRKAGVIQSYTRHATSLQPLLSDVDRIELPELSLDVP